MSEAIESARKLIAARLADLESEAKSLEAALASLGAGGPGRHRKSASPRRSTRRPESTPRRRKGKAAARAPRGRRREQFLAALQKSPGAKATALAKEIGISANQAYTLAGRLQREGAIRKHGKGYRVASAKVAA